MDKDAVIATLREHRADLERMGVIHAALFGSLARGEAGPDSDIDIAVDLLEGTAPDMWSYAGLKRQIGELFPGPVDVVDRASLKPRMLAEVTRDAVYAF
ncbi:MAG TPA: nucleotidyltransferase family protein [Devosia sp.]|jgi:hypothetical protein|nr:nucleotidyltransferase family protein [Devosia sp.]